MNEMRYRRRIRWLITILENSPEIQLFLRAMLESQLAVVTQLQNVLEQDDPEMLDCAVYVTTTLQIQALAAAVIHVYETCNNYTLQKRILSLIGDIRHEQVQDLLMRTIQASDDTELRIAAAVSLQEGEHPEIVAPLLELVNNPAEDAHLRGYILEAIAYQGDKAIVPLLLPFLQDPEPVVRWDAVFAVGCLGDASFAAYIEPLLSDTTPISGMDSASIAHDAREVLDKWASNAGED